MTDEPLIYTSKGNLPIASLDYTTTAEVVNMNVVLAEEWRLEGEIVKRAVHVVPLEGLNIGAEQAQIG
jgi:hypothetical protein